ncbi:VTT domain-containing protein [Candidatus Gracilibacteria bacterium]|nr:VTT domain-containing protein [Candidatus Gracilibacteria bacterium]
MDIISQLDSSIIEKLQAGGYVLMLILMTIEGPLVTLAAAFLASLGMFDIRIVFLLGWCGDIFGDLIFYTIGRYGLNLFSKKTRVDTVKKETFITRLDTLIHENLALAILIIKFTPYAPPIGLAYIGKIGVNFRKYLFTSLFVCAPIPFIAALCGFHIGYLNTIFTRFSGLELVGYLLITLSVFAFGIGSILFLKRKTKRVLESKK